MKTEYRMDLPFDVDFEMKITMTLGEWLELVEDLSNNHPSWRLKNDIKSMVRQAKEKFIPEVDDAETTG